VDVLGVFLDGCILYFELRVSWAKGDPNPFWHVVFPHHWFSFHDGIERSQALLAIHDQQIRNLLFCVCPYLPLSISNTVLPEKQVPDGEAFVHRVEEITNFGRIPDKGPLDIRQTNFTIVDVFDQLEE
jgi:hypothetical protein